MKNKVITILIKYFIAVLIASLTVLLVLWLRDYWNQENLVEKYRYLADAFTIPGILYIMFGLLLFLINQGALSSLSYMLKRFVNNLIPFSVHKDETYAAYLSRRKELKGYSYLFIIGIVFLFVGIVFTILFFQ